jgi:ATP-dependent DNA ligase
LAHEALVDYIEGTALFQRVQELDPEGIVTKHKSGPYVSDREKSTWFKIPNRGFSEEGAGKAL